MRIDPKNGLIDSARQVCSPNFDEWPDTCQPELIVIHNISLPPGQFGGAEIDDFFSNALDCTAHPYFAEIAAMQVSAHALIRRDGQLVQYVPLTKRAWHAGRSCYNGRTACNDFSIGIELEGTDEIPYTESQYARLAELIAALLEAYPTLSVDRIVGHCDIAPDRKTDPGASFDWQELRSLLNKRHNTKFVQGEKR
ncbi:MAG: 1,6-anhydro-N-acetylmuramyl-L-alanine amidase AmpD [Gammaproteobacteria bacterium]|nr:1,6-anhydro-N-acetylmuramyl-L-alanine amidase AmpD [Gammaproteobacteria bacterium]